MSDGNTDNTPPADDVYIEAIFGPGAFDRADASFGYNANYQNYYEGRSCGGSQLTCNAGTGLSFRIRPGTNFAPVMIGWQKHVRVGVTTTTTYESQQLDPTCTALTYPHVVDSGDITYRDNFHVWLKT